MSSTITGTLQVKNGKFYAVLNLKHPNGKRKQTWISTGLAEKNNKRLAEKKLREIITEFESKNVEFDCNMKFWQLLEAWLASAKTHLRASTYEEYSSVMRVHLLPYFKAKNIKARDLCPHHLEEYYSYKRETLSLVTVKKHHINIHSALEYGRKNRIVSTNVAKDVSFESEPRKQYGSFYTMDQIKLLLDAVTGDAIEVPVRLISQYGLRRSEALGLKWNAIDYNNHTIHISAALVNVGTTPTFVEATKSYASTRALPMSPQMEAYLKLIQAKQLEQMSLYGDRYHNDGYVCATDYGDIITPTRLSKRFKVILERNNLPHIRLHDLRHSAATNLLSKGFSLKDVSTWLGHSNISTTANIYGHVLDVTKMEMANALAV